MHLTQILLSGSTSIPNVDDVAFTPAYNSTVPELSNLQNGLPMYGHIPGSITITNPGDTHEDGLKWFESPTDFEYQHQSRGFYHRNHIPKNLFKFLLEEQIQQFNKNVERLIIQRILPAPYSKSVGWSSPMFVGNLDTPCWNYWISTHNCIPTIQKQHKYKYPDHEGKRDEIFCTIGWEGGSYPNLATPHWYFTKWVEQGYQYKIYRGVVKSIYFVYNHYSDNVRVKFTYETHRYDPHYRRWEYC